MKRFLQIKLRSFLIVVILFGISIAYLAANQRQHLLEMEIITELTTRTQLETKTIDPSPQKTQFLVVRWGFYVPKMTVGYQGPKILQGIANWCNTKIFDRAIELELMRHDNVTSAEIAALKQLKRIQLRGDIDLCKAQLTALIPTGRLSHFETGPSICVAILK